MKVLCFGSLNIDYTYRVDHFVKKGETLSSESMMVFSGGKGLNQSIALAKAKARTFHAGAIGEEGRFLLRQLEDNGVDTSYISVRQDIRSGHAIIQNDAEGDNCILLYGGANQAITREQVDRVIARLEEGDYLILQNEINQTAYIMECASKKGLKIVLNPSPMNGKVLQLPLGLVDYLILNEIEAVQILGMEGVEPVEGAVLGKALKERFPQATIVLTMGAEGAVCIDGQEVILQQAYKAKVLDTTGAGDTFTGFFIGGVIRGLDHRAAMEEAARASSIAVTRQGAASSIPELAEVENFGIPNLP